MINSNSLFHYSITRSLNLGFWPKLIWILIFLIATVVITIFNAAAVAYELVPITSTTFNNPYSFWYEKFIPRAYWKPQNWICEGSIIGLNSDAVSTNVTDFYTYTLVDFIDEQPNAPINGLLYESTSITDCSILSLYVLQYVSSPVQTQSLMVCNASSSQALALQSNVALQPISLNALSMITTFNPVLGTSNPINISTVIADWFWSLETLSDLIVPNGMLSIFNPSLTSGNLSSLSFDYENSPNSVPNTPAYEFWTLTFTYIPSDSFLEEQIPIVFLSTGEIDLAQTLATDLSAANTILAPTIGIFQNLTGDKDFDIWPFMNWIFVSWYWLHLYDFGQLAPIYYTTSGSEPDFSTTIRYPPTNNIFVNATLFEIYSTYLRNVIFPMISNVTYGALPEFLPLDDNNFLQPINSSFPRSYPCQKRVSKWWGTAVISVFAAEYALLVGGYSLFILLAKFYQRRTDNDAYKCEGCVTKNDSRDEASAIETGLVIKAVN